jgi:aspartate kinase
MVGQVGFDLNLMKIIEKYNVSYILKATNANSITMVIWEKDRTNKLIKELSSTYFGVTEKKVALVCALGTNIAKPGSLAAATRALYENKINIEAVSQSLMQVNMQFVIKRVDYKKAIIALNKALCQDK